MVNGGTARPTTLGATSIDGRTLMAGAILSALDAIERLHATVAAA